MITDSLIQVWLDGVRNASGELMNNRIKAILNMSVPRTVLLEKHKSLEPMTDDQMKETILFINEIRPNSETKEEDAKMVYTIGNLL